MKFYLVIVSLLISLLMSALPAVAGGTYGPCEPTDGTHQFSTSLIKTITSPEDNYKGKTFPDFYTWNLGAYYGAQCQCPDNLNPNNTTPVAISYRGESSLPTGHNDGKQYYRINENLEFSAAVWIEGTLQQYINIPFDDISNGWMDYASRECLGYGPTPSNIGSGSKGSLDLYIAKPFVGESVIPQTKLLSIYATLAPGVYSSVAMSDVYISGVITVNQGCTMPAGYSVEIPFGEYNARDFKGKVGARPDNVRVIEKTLTFTCSNISDGVKVYLRLEGKANAGNPSAIDLGNPDIGAVVTDEHDNILAPNSTTSTEMQVTPLYNETQRDAQIKIKSYPIGITGKIPKSGDFEGVATIDLNVE